MSHGADEWSHQEDHSSADDEDLNYFWKAGRGKKRSILELQSLLVSMRESVKCQGTRAFSRNYTNWLRLAPE